MTLKVVGLVSGGKDSLYCLAHCVQQGHTIVALANLQSQAPDESLQQDEVDLDSFMYQTVGHSVIPLYEKALELPLYRQTIAGKAHQVDKQYDPTKNRGNDHDETEDMFLLLQRVLENHPEVNAVSAGAISSTYQRVRVESVAVRLGLVPLAFLWQYPCLPPPPSRQDSLTSLLDDMALAGCDARIIKTASAGIHRRMLLKNIADHEIRQRLVQGLSVFANDELELRGSVLGEGGEYETLALDGPANLWKKRIQIVSSETVDAHSDTLYAKLKEVTVEGKTAGATNVPIPATFDKRFMQVYEHIMSNIEDSQCDTSYLPKETTPDPLVLPFSFSATADGLHICNITSSVGHTAADQFKGIMNVLNDTLTKYTAELALGHRHIVSTFLLLRDMEDFLEVNKVYSTTLWADGGPLPPARVAVAASLPDNVLVSLSMVLSKNIREHREGLHVQSRSYWAPANIGPYSQAIRAPIIVSNLSSEDSAEKIVVSVVHMAGQIPLDPASMTVQPGSLPYQAVLSLQHLWRVGQEQGVDLWAHAGVAYLPRNTNPDLVPVLAGIWRKGHEVDEAGRDRSSDNVSHDTREDEEVDLWDVQFNSSRTTSLNAATPGSHLHKLPNYEVFGDNALGYKSFIPTFIAAQVSELPRKASIEWWSTGLAGVVSATQAQYCHLRPIEGTTESWSFRGLALEMHHNTANDSGSSNQANFVCFLTLLVFNDTSQHKSIPGSQAALGHVILRTLLSDISVSDWITEVVTCHTLVNISTSPAGLLDMPLVKASTVVPCYNVWATVYEGLRRAENSSEDCCDGQDACRSISAALIMRLDLSPTNR